MKLGFVENNPADDWINPKVGTEIYLASTIWTYLNFENPEGNFILSRNLMVFLLAIMNLRANSNIVPNITELIS